MTVTLGLTRLEADRVVDARRTSWGSMLVAKRGIGAVPVGGVVEVRSIESSTLRDLPAWANKVGHHYLGSLEEAGYMRLFVEKAH